MYVRQLPPLMEVRQLTESTTVAKELAQWLKTIDSVNGVEIHLVYQEEKSTPRLKVYVQRPDISAADFFWVASGEYVMVSADKRQWRELPAVYDEETLFSRFSGAIGTTVKMDEEPEAEPDVIGEALEDLKGIRASLGSMIESLSSNTSPFTATWTHRLSMLLNDIKKDLKRVERKLKK